MSDRRAGLWFAAGMAAILALGWGGFPRLLYRPVAPPLAFSHKAHTNDAGMACEDCHAFNGQGRFAGIPPAAKCAECHEAPIGASPEEAKLVEAYVTKGIEIPWRASGRQPDNARFPHAAHVKLAKIACETCHGPVGGSEAIPPARLDPISGYGHDTRGMSECESCHAERGVRTGCLACHK